MAVCTYADKYLPFGLQIEIQLPMISTHGIQVDAILVSDHSFAKVLFNPSTSQKALHASAHFAPGEVICPFHAGITTEHPSYLTLQIGECKHITLLPECLQYTNHSCSPTAFFDTTSMHLVCIRELHPGDEITFFYPSTEWEMAQPFDCRCGSPECLKVIDGAARLPADILSRYRLTDFINEKKHAVTSAMD
jgi:hypothetical protein